MIEIKEKVQKLTSIFQNQQSYHKLIDQKLGLFKKKYSIPSMPLFEGLIRLMSMCLIVDYFISALKPQSQQIKYMNELRKKRESLLNKIKQQKSILIIQGKMRQHSKSENLQLLAIKITYYILSITIEKLVITQQQLFKRLNILICGVNISSKCYKLSLNKVNKAKKTSQIPKQKQVLQLRRTKTQKQDTQFNKIFLSLNSVCNQNKKPVVKKNNGNSNNNQKIANIIQKVKNTIHIQMKKLKSLNPPSVKKQIKKENSDQSSQIQDKAPPRQKRLSVVSISFKKNSSRSKKRVGTINYKQNIQSRFKNLKDCVPSSESLSEQSLQSLPQTNQNWYKPHNKIKVKRVYTLSLPGFANAKQR